MGAWQSGRVLRTLYRDPAVKSLSIELFSCDDTIRSAIRTAFKGNQYSLTEITDSKKPPRTDINEQRQSTIGRLDLPDRVDFVVSRSALNRKTEGLAATLALKQNRSDVYAVVLPEGLDWLRTKLDERQNLVLVGSDQAK